MRQGTEPILEMPVTIREPDNPLAPTSSPLLIMPMAAVTSVGPLYRLAESRSPMNRQVEVASGSRNGSDPRCRRNGRQCCDCSPRPRHIPDEVTNRFSQSVWVGSSLIISDEDLNKETGPATDFIVVSSTDPQGGLMTRKPEFPNERVARYVDRRAQRPFRPFGGFFANLFGN